MKFLKKIYGYINNNNKMLFSFNSSLIEFIKDNSFIKTFNKNILVLENIINLSNLYNLYDLCNQNKKEMLNEIIRIYSQSKKTLETLKVINNNYHEIIDEIINEFDQLKETNDSKFKTFFTSKNKIKKTFDSIKIISPTILQSISRSSSFTISSYYIQKIKRR